MRDRILKCHSAWILGYIGYLFLLFLLATNGVLNNLPGTFHNFGLSNSELLTLAPIMGLLSCFYVCLKNKDRYPAIALHCREAVNFQISYTGYQFTILLFLYWCWASQSSNPFANNNLGNFALFLVVSPLVLVVETCRFVLTIIALRKTSKGEFYRYPGSLHFW
jgi:uncharacterized Tic20 family protein